MKKLIRFALIIGLLLPILTFGQDPLNEVAMPNYNPPSPTAYSLGIYGLMPVGLYTGAANFDLPLYTYKTNNISVPISVSYNSNGVKVDDFGTNIGLDWNLNAGGVITKIVRGRPDVNNVCLYPLSEISNPYESTESINFFDQVGNHSLDAEPDLYVFNFFGKTGKFVFDKDNNPVLLPYQDITVQKTSAGFTITTSDGSKYYFDAAEETKTRLSAGGSVFSNQGITAWYLTKIESIYGDIVQLEYDDLNYNYHCGITQSYKKFYPANQLICDGEPYLEQPTFSPFYFSNLWVNPGKRLSRIYSNNNEYGEIKFLYLINHPEISTFKLLSKIQVIDKSLNEIESFDFNYLIIPGNERAFLQKINYKDPSKSYQFDYFNPEQLPKRLSYSQDHWGYFNGQPNSKMVPFLTNTIFGNYEGANKNPYPAYSKLGLLKKITYPTKGSTEIEYEANTYWGSVTNSGQTANIELLCNDVECNDPSTTTDCIKEFTLNNICSDQTINMNISVVFDNTYNTGCEYNSLHCNCNFTIRDKNNNIVQLLVWSPTQGQLIPRINQSEFTCGDPQWMCTCFANLSVSGAPYTFRLKTGHNHNCLSAMASINYYTTPSSTIWTNILTGGNRIKKTINFDPLKNQNSVISYHYTKCDDPSQSSGIVKREPFYISDITEAETCYLGFDPPIPYTKLKHYKVICSSSISNLFNTNGRNVYYKNVTVGFGDNFENGGEDHYFLDNDDMPGTPILGSMIYEAPWNNDAWWTGIENKVTTFKMNSNGSKIILNEKFRVYTKDLNYSKQVIGYAVRKNWEMPSQNQESILDNLDITKYKNNSFWFYLYSEKNTQWDENGQNPIISTTTYSYENPTHIQLTKTETTASNGDVILNKIYYPEDLKNNNDHPFMQDLLNQYRIAEPVKKQTWVNNELKSTIVTEYWNNWNHSSLLLPQVIKSSFGTGNLLPKVRFYDYGLNGNVLNLSKENDIHIAYYWAYNQTQPVVKADNVSSYTDFFTAIGDATYYATSIYNPSLATRELDVLLNWVGNLTDNQQKLLWKNFNTSLRNNPLLSNSAVSTFTYKSLVGLTSSTDQNGNTQYYEYDSYNRLSLIRDMDGNIIQKYTYNYSAN